MTAVGARCPPDYSLSGWRFRSSIPVEALPLWDGELNHAVDVELVDGQVDEVACSDPVGVVVTSKDVATVVVAGVGRFAVSAGRRVVAHLQPGALPGMVEVMIAGPVLGTLCYQRGILSLHSNTIVIDGKAVAMSGRSGAGKSTMAAILMKRGHRLISDDVLPLCEANGQTFAIPGSQNLRLWGETLDVLGEDKTKLRRAADGEREKYFLPTIDKTTRPFPLAALLWLERGEKDRIWFRPDNGIFRTRAIYKAAYRQHLAREFAAMGSKEIMNLSLPGVAVYDLLRPRGLEMVEEQAAMIEEFVRSLDVPTAGPAELRAARL